jgi:hypothetical protein
MDFVEIPGGIFELGWRRVTLAPFQIARHGARHSDFIGDP